MELRRPQLTDKQSVVEMVAEFETHQSHHDGGFWKSGTFSYEDWLSRNQEMEVGLGLSKDQVPAIQFVAFDADNRAVGFLNLRLRLNESLLEKSGHIGYSIRPTERGKGYAKEALRLGLKTAKEKNLKNVLVTCHVDNMASRAVILANGGRLEDIRHKVERYWIDVE